MTSENLNNHETAPISTLSHSSILILSGFLVGTATGGAVRPEIEYLVLAAGLIGLIAYLVFALLSSQRRQQKVEQETKQALHRMEVRLDRHLSQEESAEATDDGSRQRTWSLAEIEMEYQAVKRARRMRQMASEWDSPSRSTADILRA